MNGPAARSRRAVLRSVVSLGPGTGDLVGHVYRHGLTDLTELAAAHGIAGLLHSAVTEAGLQDAAGAELLATETRRARLQHVRALADLAGVGRALRGTGVPVTVVKGPALVHRWYRPGERGYADLDLVVPPGSFADALGHLESGGFTLLDANWPLLLDAEVAQLRLRAPSGGLVDLHWHLLNDVLARRVHDLGRDVWSPGTEQVVLGGVEVEVLRPHAALVHLCVHAAASGAHRLVWLSDVDRVARAIDDWAGALAIVEQARVRPAVGLVLGRSSRLLGTPVPPAVLRAVLPRSASLLCRAVDRVSPVPGRTATGSVAQLAARSAAEAWGPTARRVVGRSAEWVRRGSRTADRSSAALFDADDPRSALFPAGGPGGRSAYLSWVASAG